MTARRFAGITVVLALLALHVPARAQAPATAQIPASGQRAWIDPATGELGAPPPEALAAEPAGGGAAAPWVVEPGWTSAGGVMIDLRGRPLYSFEARLTPEGEVVTDCVRQGE